MPYIHSKGPWVAEQSFVSPASHRCISVRSADGGAVAFANIWYDAEDQGRANLALIAAAPELREIADLLIGTPASAQDVIDEIQARATAVLAKIK